MAHIAFDTLEYAQALRDAGMPQKEAEAFARANASAFRQMLGQQELATKTDLEKTRLVLTADMDKLRQELKTDMAKLRQELKADMAKLRQDGTTELEKTRLALTADMDKLRQEVKADMATLEARLVKHMFNMLLAFAGAIGAFFAIAAFFLKS